MSIINTREIVKIIKEKQKEKFALFADAHGHRPRLCIFFVGTDSASELYVKVKKKYAEEVLVDIVEKRFENITTDALVSEVEKMKTECEGMIVQLPLPETIDKDLVLKSIPTNLDIDLLAPVLHTNCGCGECGVSKSDFVQPVAFAVKSILKSYDVSLFGKQVVVLGKGKLVGQPVLEILEDMLIRECQQSLLAGETVHIRSELAKLVSLDKSDMETYYERYWGKETADIINSAQNEIRTN
jgi:methylenetetrahydrofolate dehydrogenase (NADP+)/methenyltetrahydrofolate cyclohydrolase